MPADRVDAPPRARMRRRPPDVLAVHEQLLVQPPGPLEDMSRKQHERPGHGIDVAFLVLLPERPSSASPARRAPSSLYRPRSSSSARRRPGNRYAVFDRRPDRPAGSARGRSRVSSDATAELGDGNDCELCIAVDEQQPVAVRAVRHALVVGRADLAVVRVAYESFSWGTPRQPCLGCRRRSRCPRRSPHGAAIAGARESMRGNRAGSRCRCSS